MIYIDIFSQKKPSYGGSKNWVLIQDCDTKKLYFFKKTKEYLSEKVTPSWKKMNALKKNVKIIFFTNSGENKILGKLHEELRRN